MCFCIFVLPFLFKTFFVVFHILSLFFVFFTIILFQLLFFNPFNSFFSPMSYYYILVSVIYHILFNISTPSPIFGILSTLFTHPHSNIDPWYFSFYPCKQSLKPLSHQVLVLSQSAEHQQANS